MIRKRPFIYIEYRQRSETYLYIRNPTHDGGEEEADAHHDAVAYSDRKGR